MSCRPPENIYDAIEWVALLVLIGFIVWVINRKE